MCSPRPRPPQTFFWLFRRRRVRSKECSLTSIHLRFRLLKVTNLTKYPHAANHRHLLNSNATCRRRQQTTFFQHRLETGPETPKVCRSRAGEPTRPRSQRNRGTGSAEIITPKRWLHLRSINVNLYHDGQSGYLQTVKPRKVKPVLSLYY